MKAIGIDIGTTSICAVLTDCETGRLLEAETLANNSRDTSSRKYEKLQNPAEILKTIMDLNILQREGIKAIGVTGQMHGILYVDKKCQAISPLYTWQDGRGDLPFDDELTYTRYLCRETGYNLAAGYGLVTHYYNVKNSLVPKDAAYLCTIGDYIAASLAGAEKPIMHPTNAGSLGFYHMTMGFDKEALSRLGVKTSILPTISKGSLIGYTKSGAAVRVATGDNQASVLGAAGMKPGVIINIGTGSQISAIAPYSDALLSLSENIEMRPYFGDNVLIVGCGLMGGDAYALLHGFFAKTAEMLGLPAVDIYAKMDEWLKNNPVHNDLPYVDTRFKGTRRHPSIRGKIVNISDTGFTPQHLIHGFLEGIAEELWQLYNEMPIKSSGDTITGAGNGLRKNQYLRGLFEQKFNKTVHIPPYEEEAAYGAALFAASAI